MGRATRRVTGILSALITPYARNGQVDDGVLRTLVEWEISRGIHGFFVCGGTGEGVLLSAQERKHVLETVVKTASGRVPVVAHIGTLNWKDLEDLARHASGAGAQAVAAVPPFYFKPDMDGLRRYYGAVAKWSGIPTWLYHVPVSTNVPISSQAVATLYREIEGVQGIKMTSFDLFEMGNMRDLTGGGINVLSGYDEILLAALAIGADGAIGTTYNYLPRLAANLYAAHKEGRMDAAREAAGRIRAVVRCLVASGRGLAASKLVMEWLGFPCGPGREPVGELSPEQAAEFRRSLEATGFFEDRFNELP